MSDTEDETIDESEEQNWEEWEEDEQDQDQEHVVSLFSDAVLPSVEAALEHDKQRFSFDLRVYKQQVGLSDYDVIRCINFIRSEVAAGRDVLPHLATATSAAHKPWDDDKYLQPVLQDDALLFYDFESEDEPRDNDNTQGVAAPASSSAEELRRLRDENAALREALAELVAATMPEELREAAAQPGEAGAGAGEGPSTSAAALGDTVAAQRVEAVRRVDKCYFDAYSGFSIHREMLGDKARTESYMHALERNPGLVRGKVVLDVGCGTSILSMFAARAGAAKVVGVDGSSTIAAVARKVLAANGLGEEAGGPVSIVTGKLEEMKQLPVDKVDIIVSEWMGYALLFETMLDTVLYARDRFLAPGGAVLPDIARLHIAGVSEDATGLDFWKDVYGFSMASIAGDLRAAALNRGVVCEVSDKCIITDTCTVKELDLCSMTPADQDFTAPFRLVPHEECSSSGRELAAIVLWFDTDFSARFCKEHPVTLSTSPFLPKTHWVQTLLMLREPVPLGPQGAQEVTGRFSMSRNPASPRSLDISVEYSARLQDGTVVKSSSLYNMDILGEE